MGETLKKWGARALEQVPRTSLGQSVEGCFLRATATLGRVDPHWGSGGGRLSYPMPFRPRPLSPRAAVADPCGQIGILAEPQQQPWPLRRRSWGKPWQTWRREGLRWGEAKIWRHHPAYGWAGASRRGEGCASGGRAARAGRFLREQGKGREQARAGVLLARLREDVCAQR